MRRTEDLQAVFSGLTGRECRALSIVLGATSTLDGPQIRGPILRHVADLVDIFDGDCGQALEWLRTRNSGFDE
jgi:hypothetical protein